MLGRTLSFVCSRRRCISSSPHWKILYLERKQDSIKSMFNLAPGSPLQQTKPITDILLRSVFLRSLIPFGSWLVRRTQAFFGSCAYHSSYPSAPKLTRLWPLNTKKLAAHLKGHRYSSLHRIQVIHTCSKCVLAALASVYLINPK